MDRSTQNSRIIKAPAEKIFLALTTPEALETWQVPGNMKGKVHSFNPVTGGGYEMSLFYPDNEKEMQRKTGEKEDRFTVKFTKLIPFRKIVEEVNFDTTDPDLVETMTIEIMLEPAGDGTDVIFLFKNIPVGIKLEDNEKGTISSLEKLARYVE